MARLVPLQTTDRTTSFRPIIELTKYGKLLCYEKCGGRWFRSSQWWVEDALAQLQGLYENLGEVNLNELYSLLGLVESNKGRIFGWNSILHGENTILLRVELIEKNFMTMDEPVLVITPTVFPEKDYKEAF